MMRRIHILIPGRGSLYPATTSLNVNHLGFLTEDKWKARKYRGDLNADRAVDDWKATLNTLGFSDFDIWHEDATA